jgi:hypothetical protein
MINSGFFTFSHEIKIPDSKKNVTKKTFFDKTAIEQYEELIGKKIRKIIMRMIFFFLIQSEMLLNLLKNISECSITFNCLI